MFPVVYSFCSSKKFSSSTLNTLKKWFPNVKVEEFSSQNTCAVVLEWVNTETEANQVIHKAVEHGYWGGFWMEGQR